MMVQSMNIYKYIFCSFQMQACPKTFPHTDGYGKVMRHKTWTTVISMLMSVNACTHTLTHTHNY